MKKILATAILAIGLYSANAQHRPHESWKSLNLSEEQKDKMAELRKEHHEKMMAILTPAQREQFDRQKAERKVKRQAHAAARMEKLSKKLQLTPEQSSKMTALNQSFRQDAELIRANQALAAAEQRKQLKDLSAAHQADVKAILDPSQQAILEDLKARRHKPTGR